MEQILLEDNKHWLDSTIYDDFAPRDILSKAKEFLKTKEVLAIIGARRVGKSTLARLLIKGLLEDGIKSSNIFFINLEKPAFLPFRNNPSYLEKIYEEYQKIAAPDQSEKIYFFIDEIQIFENWQVFIKSRYENSNIKFIITGSNSSLLTENYATVLTGRVLKLNLESFSFREFLNYKEIDISTRLLETKNRVLIRRALDEYLKWGGYFSVISNDNIEIKKEIIKNIAEDIILKDIVPRYSIKNSSEIRDLFFYIVSNSTNIINYTNLANKLKIDPKTVKEYIDYFEDNFLIKTVSNYDHKLSTQMRSAKKIYLKDNGFLNLSIFTKQNLSQSLENLVFLHLSQKDPNITYLKDRTEIDFYSHKNMYQVSFSLQDEKTRKRELDAFVAFEEMKADKKWLITYDENSKTDDVEIVSCDRFLLSH